MDLHEKYTQKQKIKGEVGFDSIRINVTQLYMYDVKGDCDEEKGYGFRRYKQGRPITAADSFSGSCSCGIINTNEKSGKKGDKWHYCQTPISQIKSTKILKGKLIM